MITTKKAETLWLDIDELFIEKPPEGALTVAMVAEHYGCSPSTARRRLNKLVEAGWAEGTYILNGTVARYVVKPSKEDVC